MSFSSSSHSVQDNEKSQLAHFTRFKRQFTRIVVYKVLHFFKDRGKSFGPGISSKGLQVVVLQMRRPQLSPRLENAVADLIVSLPLEKFSFG